MNDAPRAWAGLTFRMRWALVMLLVVILLYAGRGQILPLPARWLDVSTPPEPVDYVLVLNGDVHTRPFVAAALVKAQLAQQALVAETVYAPAEQDGILPPEHEMVRQVLIRRGVPEYRVQVLPGEIDSTFDEAHVLAAFLLDKPDATVAIVTSDFHTRRARWTFRHVLGGRAEQLRFVSAPKDSVSADNWWQTPVGVVIYISEYLKFAYYMVRY